MTCKLKCPGVYKPGSDDLPGRCYVYEVLQAICIEVAPVLDVKNVINTWEYRGGCFEDDEPAVYERAQSGQIYTFEDISIEVRADADPFNVAAK